MGRVNIIEALVILIAIMWLLGYFRRLSASANKTQNPAPGQNRGQQVGGQHKPSKPGKYGDDNSEYIDYEEVKD